MDSLCWAHGGTQGVDGTCVDCLASRVGQWAYVRYSDGMYSIVSVKDEAEARKWEANGSAVKYFYPSEWRAWRAHCDADAVWQCMFRDLDNRAYEANKGKL